MTNPVPGVIRQLPVIGPWVGKVGKVFDIASAPCDPDPYVMVLAAWHASPYLIWSLLKPDTIDQTAARWGGAHKRRRKKRAIIDHLQGPDAPIPKGKIGWAMFRSQGLAQKAGWYMIIADATVDFALHWTSTVYQMAGCRSPATTYAQQSLASALVGDTGGSWAIITVWNFEDANGFICSPSSITIPPGNQSMVGFQIVPNDPGAPFTTAPSWEAALYNATTNTFEAETGVISTAQGFHADSQITRNWAVLNPTRTYQVAIKIHGGHLRLQGSRFYAYGGTEGGLLPDP